MSFLCPCCGEVHNGLPDIAFDRPLYAHNVSEAERAERVQLASDLCIVDDAFFFARGVLEIPIRGTSETLGLGVWISLKRENFDTYADHFHSANIGPFFGWLSNDFSFGGVSALNLKTMAHFRGHSLRPRIELAPDDHPLAVAQRDGIRMDQAWTFVHGYLD